MSTTPMPLVFAIAILASIALVALIAFIVKSKMAKALAKEKEQLEKSEKNLGARLADITERFKAVLDVDAETCERGQALGFGVDGLCDQKGLGVGKRGQVANLSLDGQVGRGSAGVMRERLTAAATHARSGIT